MKILYVVNYAEFFLSHRAVLAEAARAAGHEVHVATQDGPLVPKVRAMGFPFHVLPRMRGTTRPDKELRTLSAMVRLFRRLQPDLVHLVSIKPVLYGGLAARIARVPAVVSAVSGLGSVFVAEGLPARLRREAVQLGYRAAFAHPNLRVIVQNEADREFLVGNGLVRRERTVLIPGSGVDLSRFSPTPEPSGDGVVVLPARMLRDKGVVEFAEAARLCREAGSKARFLLAGGLDPDNPSAVSEDEIRRWERSGHVEWLGHRDDMSAVYASANVVCLPSYREGLSKALIEAAACGRAIVTTDVPGCRDVVQNGRQGLLVPPRDPVALHRALLSLLASPEARAAFATEARSRAVAEFGVTSVLERSLQLYGRGRQPGELGRPAIET